MYSLDLPTRSHGAPWADRIKIEIETRMPRISRSSLLISIAIMIAMVTAACDSPASKPTAEPDPPTPIPTVTTEVESTTEEVGSRLGVREAFTDPDVRACLLEEMGDDALDNIGQGSGIGLGEEWVAAFEKCGVEQGGRATGGGRLGGGFVGSGIADPEVRACLLEEMGEDALDNLGQGSGVGLGEDWVAAFEKCGVDSGDGAGLFGGRRGAAGGGFAGGAFADPETQECLAAELGEDFGSSEGGIFGGLTGGGLSEDLTAAFEECGIDLSAGFGGRLGAGGFGGGAFGGGGRGGFGGLGGDGSFQECLTEALGEDAMLLLRNPEGPPSTELQEALQECGNVVAIPVESGSDTGEDADPVLAEPAATSIPVSELTIEQLTCLSSELEPGDLASAVVAASSGNLSTVSDTVLAALQTCEVGS
jgi:hypothetical protein